MRRVARCTRFCHLPHSSCHISIRGTRGRAVQFPGGSAYLGVPSLLSTPRRCILGAETSADCGRTNYTVFCTVPSLEPFHPSPPFSSKGRSKRSLWWRIATGAPARSVEALSHATRTPFQQSPRIRRSTRKIHTEHQAAPAPALSPRWRSIQPLRASPRPRPRTSNRHRRHPGPEGRRQQLQQRGS